MVRFIIYDLLGLLDLLIFCLVTTLCPSLTEFWLFTPGDTLAHLETSSPTFWITPKWLTMERLCWGPFGKAVKDVDRIKEANAAMSRRVDSDNFKVCGRCSEIADPANPPADGIYHAFVSSAAVGRLRHHHHRLQIQKSLDPSGPSKSKRFLPAVVEAKNSQYNWNVDENQREEKLKWMKPRLELFMLRNKKLISNYNFLNVWLVK